jgi:hypothetical protein
VEVRDRAEQLRREEGRLEERGNAVKALSVEVDRLAAELEKENKSVAELEAEQAKAKSR